MTTRHTLTEQASEVIANAEWALDEGCPSGAAALDYVPHAEALYDADWRPVSDDDATVEKVAKAIFGLPEGAWDQLHEGTRSDYRHEARAAIAALRGDSNA